MVDEVSQPCRQHHLREECTNGERKDGVEFDPIASVFVGR